MTSGIMVYMKKINATKFKEQCLAILEDLGSEGIIITKHGKVVAKVVPLHAESATLIGCMKGKLKIYGDLFSTGVAWDVES